MNLNAVNQVAIAGAQDVLWNNAPVDLLNECVVAGAQRYFSPIRAGYYALDARVRFGPTPLNALVTLYLQDAVPSWYAGISYTNGVNNSTPSLHVFDVRYLVPGNRILTTINFSAIGGGTVIEGSVSMSKFIAYRIR